MISEFAELEDNYASSLEISRQTLKQIRNTESSVHPTRENKRKITDQIAHLKYKDPTSSKIMTLEQELVRAEAENLVAEAQLTNITRQKLKEAYEQQIDAIVERSEKQVILAKHTRRLLELLDDTPVVPGADRAPYENERVAKEILIDAEEELGKWVPSEDSFIPSSRLDNDVLPPVVPEFVQLEVHDVAGDGGEGGQEVDTNHVEASADANDAKALESEP